MRTHYRIHEFASRVGRSAQTVRRWERGKLTAKRLPSGQVFDLSDVRNLMGGAPDKKDAVVYCRVSSAGQKVDLASQVSATEAYCLSAAIPVDRWARETGGGMNSGAGIFCRSLIALNAEKSGNCRLRMKTA